MRQRTNADREMGLLSRMVAFNLIFSATRVVLKVWGVASAALVMCEPAYRVCLPKRTVELSLNPSLKDNICVQSEVSDLMRYILLDALKTFSAATRVCIPRKKVCFSACFQFLRRHVLREG